MEVVSALQKLNGVARMRDLRRFGISREIIWKEIRAHRILRLRQGWISLISVSPMEIAAVEAHGLLTCASAASVLGFPAQGTHFHIRSRRGDTPELRTTRRMTPTRIGACVGIPEMIIDYATCQPAEWVVALVDHLERDRALSVPEWAMVENSVPKKAAQLIRLRSGMPESVLESVVRFRLMKARIPHSMQVPIGRFRADFVISSGIVLETHGAEFHSDRADWERDRRKVAWLKSQGWEVLEISYSQVFGEWESVLSAIRATRSKQRNRQVPKFLETKRS
jgi:very-short-patch-repair endonuclease